MTLPGKRVLITGASGLLGRALCRHFLDASWDVVGLAFSRATGNLLKVDLTNASEIEKVIKSTKPSVIVHSAAQRFPDKIEQNYSETIAINVAASETIAKLAAEENIALIAISTDYVFDGTSPPYSEDAMPNPLNKYGQTKLAAERGILKYCPDACILRVPILYGGEEYIEESAISVLLTILLDTSKVHSVSDYEIRFPTHTSDVASVCVSLAEKKLKDDALKGIFHWSGSEALTKYGMMKIISKAFSLPLAHIIPDPNPSKGAPRPRNSQLSCGRLTSLDIAKNTPFVEGIQESFAKFLPTRGKPDQS